MRSRSPVRSAPARSPVSALGTWLRLAAATAVVLGLLSLQWMNAISAQIGAEWPRRADRQAVFAAIPDGARVSAPMHALSHLSERTWLFVLPEPFIAVRVGHEVGRGGARSCRRGARLRRLRSRAPAWGSHTDAEIEQAIVDNGFREVMRRGETRLYHREPG